MIITPFKISPFSGRKVNGTPPANTIAPSISGTNVNGSTLTRVVGTYTNSPLISGIWQRDGVDIIGETNATYLLVSADMGTDITWYETASNAAGTIYTSSNVISIITTQELCKYAYNGTSKYITYGDILDSVFVTPASPTFTIERWVKLNEIGRSQIIFSKWDITGNQRSFQLQLNALNKFVWSQSSTGAAAQVIGHTQDDTFTDITNRVHIAVTFDYSQASYVNVVKIYINGSIIATTATTSAKAKPFNSTAAFALGANNLTTPATFLNADDYGVVITSRVKDAAEILADYNLGNGAEPSATGLVLYSDFKTDTFGVNWTVNDLSPSNLDGTSVNILVGDHTCSQVEILEDVI